MVGLVMHTMFMWRLAGASPNHEPAPYFFFEDLVGVLATALP